VLGLGCFGGVSGFGCGDGGSVTRDVVFVAGRLMLMLMLIRCRSRWSVLLLIMVLLVLGVPGGR
jgi:hypothetical protein